MEKCVNEIRGFSGEYRWLSNFYLCKIIFLGLSFPSIEHAYQYAKLEDDPNLENYNKIIKMSAAGVKKWSRHVKLRSSWNFLKKTIMEHLIHSKFQENKELREKLKELKGYYLEETNWWGDTYWGVCKGKGSNYLGLLLMAECIAIHIEDNMGR